MRSYNHLYESFISKENILIAINNAKKGKSNRKKVKKLLDNPNFVNSIQEYAENFHNAKHEKKQIYDGVQRKQREIIVPTFPEQVIHHMIVNVMKPIFCRGMYFHTYASIPKRGGHKGKKFIDRWIKKDTKNCKYCLKMDIKKYFNSIPHDKLLDLFKKTIHDEKFLAVIDELISVVDTGIPIGFYTSQWIANWYLQSLDHFIKENLGTKYYVRYMDDMVIFGSNKKQLHKIREKIEQYLNNELGLTMKENWQIFLFHYVKKDGQNVGRPLDFMGFKFYRNRTVLRRSIMLKASRKARHISKSKKVSIYEIRQMLSYLGWIDCTDSYGFYVKWIKPYISFQYLKRRMSKYDRRKNRIKT